MSLVLGLHREQFDISWATGHHATHKLSRQLAVSRVSIFTLWILLLLWKSQIKMPAEHKCSSPSSTKLNAKKGSLQLPHTELLVEIRTQAMFTLANHSFCCHFSTKSFDYFILLGYDAASLVNRILTFPATWSLHLQRSNCPKECQHQAET